MTEDEFEDTMVYRVNERVGELHILPAHELLTARDRYEARMASYATVSSGDGWADLDTRAYFADDWPSPSRWARAYVDLSREKAGLHPKAGLVDESLYRRVAAPSIAPVVTQGPRKAGGWYTDATAFYPTIYTRVGLDAGVSRSGLILGGAVPCVRGDLWLAYTKSARVSVVGILAGSAIRVRVKRLGHRVAPELRLPNRRRYNPWLGDLLSWMSRMLYAAVTRVTSPLRWATDGGLFASQSEAEDAAAVMARLGFAPKVSEREGRAASASPVSVDLGPRGFLPRLEREWLTIHG